MGVADQACQRLQRPLSLSGPELQAFVARSMAGCHALAAEFQLPGRWTGSCIVALETAQPLEQQRRQQRHGG